MLIDTERRPSFRKKEKHPTALFQIAIRTKNSTEICFILDFILMSEETFSSICTGLRGLFMDRNIIKLGQGLENDLKEISDSYPQTDAFQCCTSILEGNTLLRYIQPQVIQLVSLKNLTLNFLHCNLNKSQQMSNWAKRPLSKQQIHYAACDALVLLRIYDAMLYEVYDKFGEGASTDHLLCNTKAYNRTFDETGVLKEGTDMNNVDPIPPMSDPVHLRFAGIKELSNVSCAINESAGDCSDNVNTTVSKTIAKTQNKVVGKRVKSNNHKKCVESQKASSSSQLWKPFHHSFVRTNII